MGIIDKQIRSILTKEQYKEEFSHTILHNMNILHKKPLDDSLPVWAKDSVKPPQKKQEFTDLTFAVVKRRAETCSPSKKQST